MKDAFYILPADKEWAVRRIAELERTIAELGPEFEEVFAQSSETWHDNAPFDALRDRQALLAAERHTLRGLIAQASLVCPPPQKGVVGIGVTVTCEEAGKMHTFYIAGHWSPHTGTLQDGAMVITCGSPLGKALIGVKVGEDAVLAVPARRLQVKSSI